MSSYSRRAAELVLVASLSVLGASIAEAREERIRWTHPNPSEVVRFEARYRGLTDPDSAYVTVDFGHPAAAGGVYAVMMAHLPTVLMNWKETFLNSISPLNISRDRNWAPSGRSTGLSITSSSDFSAISAL